MWDGIGEVFTSNCKVIQRRLSPFVKHNQDISSKVFGGFKPHRIRISRLQCHRREIAHKVKNKFYLGTTETTDPVQWIERCTMKI